MFQGHDIKHQKTRKNKIEL